MSCRPAALIARAIGRFRSALRSSSSSVRLSFDRVITEFS
jgi:hypothetical protein